ncbi:MAG: fibronectin type III domain-containing protein [Lachnospiraceae bacterium]|nr:fibronectin type III domain-containing protein [Lachnospiraceae bacterium]
MRLNFGKSVVVFLSCCMTISMCQWSVPQMRARVAADQNVSGRFEELPISKDSLNANSIWAGSDDEWSDILMTGGLDYYAAFFGEMCDPNETGGFPSSGTMDIDSVPYQLTWAGESTYLGNDCIRLYGRGNEIVNTASMVLDKTGNYEQVYVLATAGGPGIGNYANFQVVVHYTDGTSDITDYRLYDWYDNSYVEGVFKDPQFRRIGLNGKFFHGDIDGGPYVQSATIKVDKSKTLSSLDFNLLGKNGDSNVDGLYCGIYAVTGNINQYAPLAVVATPATNIWDDSFTANWNKTDSATSYVIDVSTDPTFLDTSKFVPGYINRDLGDVNNVDVTGLSDGQKYYYRVRAVNSYGQSESSNVIEVMTLKSDEVEVQGFQMNSNKNEGAVSEFNPSIRVVSRAGKVLTGKDGQRHNTVKFGTIFAFAEGAAKPYSETLVLENVDDENVYYHEATEAGVYNSYTTTYQTDQLYDYFALTLILKKYSYDSIQKGFLFRAYAKLDNGEIRYGDKIFYADMYEIAQNLYENQKMPTIGGHNYLYNDILNVVTMNNNRVSICTAMMKALGITSREHVDYAAVNAVNHDINDYVRCQKTYTYKDRATFSPVSTDENSLLNKLKSVTGTSETKLSDWIYNHTEEYGCHGYYPKTEYGWNYYRYKEYDTE